MSFTFSPSAIDSYADLLGRGAEDVDAGKRYLNNNGEIGDATKGLLLQLGASHSQVLSTLRKQYGTLHGLCKASDRSLGEAADYYRRTESSAAEQVDATFPDGSRGPDDHPPPDATASFKDQAEPQDALTAPQPPEGWQDPLALINAVGDALSPTYWISVVLEETIGFNPVDYMAEWIAGDWEGYARCSGVWKNLKKHAADVETNIDAGNYALDPEWNGNAADAAYMYFDRLGTATAKFSDELDELRGQYELAARGAQHCASVASGCIKIIFDAAICAAIKVAAGWLLSWSGVGLVSWALAALDCIRIMDAWGTLTKELTVAQTLVNQAVGRIEIAVASHQDYDKIQFPGSPYSHPAVES